MRPRRLLDWLRYAAMLMPRRLWFLIGIGIGLGWGMNYYEYSLAFVVATVLGILFFAFLLVRFPELRKVEEKEEKTMFEYIYAYDPVVKKRVVHVVKNGWAISMVTGNRFRYVENRRREA